MGAIRTGTYATGMIAVLISSVMALIFCFRLDVWLEDYALTTLSEWPDPKDIVVVTVTEDTLATLTYRSPIDRGFLADIVGKIDKAGARAIGVDILIDQPSEPTKDAHLRATLEQANAAVVIGYAGVDEGLTERQIAFLNSWTNKLVRGLVTLTRDEFDGTIRQAYSNRVVDGTEISGLALALAKKVGAEPKLPVGRLTYYRQADATPFDFPTYPAHSVNLIPETWFKDKIVLIGSALPTADRHRTPFSTWNGTGNGSLYGVTIHAHLLAQFLQGHRLVNPAAWVSLLLVLAFATVAAAIATVPVRLSTRATMLILLLLVLIISAVVLFRQVQLLIPVVTPAVASLLTALIIAMREWHQDRRDRRFIEESFAHYVSPAVVRRIVAKRESLKMGGKVRRVTYVFTDLEGFTTMCEGMEPEQVAILLNDYLDRVCALFIERDATIDKIIGDAVVGFFGAPEEQADQCDRAVDLALAIDAFAEQYKAEKQAAGIDFGTTRIGVHTGDAVVGNFGGSRFVDYTSIGDTVNSAARMEAVNKHLGTRICVSEAVTKACPRHPFRPVGDILLKGKQSKIACFEPLQPNQLSPQHLDEYQAAYLAMEQHDNDAASMFARLTETYPNDPLVTLHTRRLQAGEAGVTLVMHEK